MTFNDTRKPWNKKRKEKKKVAGGIAKLFMFNQKSVSLFWLSPNVLERISDAQQV